MRHTQLGAAIKGLRTRSPGPAPSSLHSAPGRGEECSQAFPAKVCTPFLDSGGPPTHPKVGQRGRGLQRGSEHTAAPRGTLRAGALPEQVGGGRPGMAGEPTTRAAPAAGVPAYRPPRLPGQSWPRCGEPPGPGPREGKEGGGCLKKAQGSHQPSPRSHLHGTKGFCVGQGWRGRVGF